MGGIMKLFKRLFTIALILVMFVEGFTIEGDNNAHAAAAAPKLLITELVVNPAGPAPDLFEYIEVYNNSDAAVSLKDYHIQYIHSNGTITKWEFTEDKAISPYSAMVLWVINTGANQARTVDDFKAFYQTSLNEDQLSVIPTSGGMINNDSRTLIWTANDGNEIVRVSYTKEDVVDGKGILYKYPADASSVMQQMGLSDKPVPGLIAPLQVPEPEQPSEPVDPAESVGTALLITEIVTNPPGPAPDLFEYIEIYNNSGLPVNIGDYHFQYIHSNGNNVKWDLTENKILPAGAVMVIWVQNAAQNDGRTFGDFNQFYNLNLRDSQLSYVSTTGGMVNSDSRTLILTKDDGQEIVKAAYTGDMARPDGESIVYQYNANDPSSIEMVYTGQAKPPTPGVVLPTQVPHYSEPELLPPLIRHQPMAIIDPVDLTLSAYMFYENGVQQPALHYRTNPEGPFTELIMQSAGDSNYTASIAGAELRSASQLQYYFTAIGGSDTARLPETQWFQTEITNPETELLALNIQDNDYVRGLKLVKGTGSMDSALALLLNGEKLDQTQTVLDFPARITVEGSGIQPSGGFQNGVFVNDQLIHIFAEDVDGYQTFEIPVPSGLLKAGANKVTFRSGNLISPTDLEGNHDDYTIRNVQLHLHDGTVLTDPAFPASQTISLGDGFPPDPANAILHRDFMMTIQGSLAKAVLYEWDTTSQADGEHVLELQDENNAQSATRVRVEVDNTPPEVVIHSPLADLRYKGEIEVSADVSDGGSGLSSTEAYLDGKVIALGQNIKVAELAAGEHILHIIAADAAGNVTEREVRFYTLEENPVKPHQPLPADRATGVPTETPLRVTAADPTDDPLDVTFLKAYRYDFTDGLAHKAYAGAADTEPPLVMVPEGEVNFDAEQLEAIASDDGRHMTNQAIEQFPYQRFDMVINDDLSSARTVEAVWEGHSLPGRRVTMYAWNFATEKWQELASKVSESEADFTLRGDINVLDMVRDNKASLMVQDLIPAPEEYDFSFVWMTDTQHYAREYPGIFQSMTQWIVDKEKEQKIEYVIHTGDIVDDHKQGYQWITADQSMKILEKANIRYGVLAGNHDVQANTSLPINYTEYGQWFGSDRFEGHSYYGGGRENNRDHYDLISVHGHDFIIIYMGWQPEQESLDWADALLERYSDRNAIIALHQYIDPNGRYSGPGAEVFEQLVKPHDNVFLVLNGHHRGTSRNAVTIGDRIVHEVFANYQGEAEGGAGYLRLLKFDAEENMLHMNTYSPYKDQYNYFQNGEDEFSLPVRLKSVQKQVSTNYIAVLAKTEEVIGKQTKVASGAQANAAWNNLKHRQNYYWYVRAEDEFGGKTESDIWGFTTRTEEHVNPPQKPDDSGTAPNPVPGDREEQQPEDEEGSGLTVHIEAETVDGIAIAEIGGEQAEGRDIAIASEFANFTLPKDAIDLDALRRQLGSYDVKLIIQVEVLSEQRHRDAEKHVQAKGGSLVSKVIHFSIAAEAEGQRTAITQYNSYVSGSFALHQPADSSRLTMVRIGEDGSLAYIPAVFDGRNATFYSPVSGSYAVISAERSFQDMKEHWAESDIHLLASKMIVNGKDERRFAPDLSITRAEFAALIVRSLGYPAAAGGITLKDVPENAWYAGMVRQAALLGIVQGGADGNYRPQDNITREEMAVILNRAITTAGKAVFSYTSANESSQEFNDSNQISAWSAQAVRSLVNSGILFGMPDGSFLPQKPLSRAEAAVAIGRMLGNAGLMN